MKEKLTELIKSKKFICIAVGVIALVIIAIAVICVSLNNSGKNSESSSSSSDSSVSEIEDDESSTDTTETTTSTTTATTTSETTTTTTTTMTTTSTTTTTATTTTTTAPTAPPTENTTPPAVVTTAAPVVTEPATQPPQQLSYEQYASEIVRLTNQERQNNGLSPLSENAALNTMAAARAQELITLFSHTRPNGGDLSSIFSEYGVSWWAIGENIAMGYPSPQAVVSGWMTSDGHRKNILSSSYSSIGVGVYNYGGTLYYVQIFANLA